MTEDEQKLLHAKLNMETAQMPWKELQRHFASGHILYIEDGLDMIDVAVKMAADDTKAITQWVTEQKLGKVTDDQAKKWFEKDALLWTVVVRPWILVQSEKLSLPPGVTIN